MPNLYKYKAYLHSSSNCKLVILYFLTCEGDFDGVYYLSRRGVVVHTKVGPAGCRRDVVAGVINGEDYLGLAVRHLGSFIIAAAGTGGSGWVVVAATAVLFKSCAMTF
ncbi:hypothetical protein L3X38_018701 [Prunus dulcis]|uniref:Uncharacterized protein n=1 Tax=Prunus dulcis TaxID=3755 RepID=A0AAD4ZBD4_PRUDU|nr:hypothetical protein L3X38_018701 [Prunus dulcis]